MNPCIHCVETPASLREATGLEQVYCSHICQALAYIGIKRPRESDVDEMFETMRVLKAQKTFDVSKALDELQNNLNQYLLQAVQNNWIGAVRDLIFNRGMDSNTTFGTFKEPLLYFALKSGSKDVVNLLLEDPNLNVNLQNSAGMPAYFSVESNNLESLLMILNHKDFNVNTTDTNGKTILHHLPEYSSINDGKVILEYLLSIKNVKVNGQDENGRSALYYTCSSSRSELARLLLDHPDIDPNLAEFRTKNTPLHIAVANRNNLKTIEMLLRHPKTNPNLEDIEGRTAYDYTRNRIQRLLFRAYTLSKNFEMPYDQTKFIAARELQRKICTYLDETIPSDLLQLANILNIPDNMVQRKTKDELCIIISDVIATGAIWDKERFEDVQAFRQKVMVNFAKGALLKPWDQVKREIEEYFGISTLDQMSAAQVWSIVGKFRRNYI